MRRSEPEAGWLYGLVVVASVWPLAGVACTAVSGSGAGLLRPLHPAPPPPGQGLSAAARAATHIQLLIEI